MGRLKLGLIGLAALAIAGCSALQGLTSPGPGDATTVAAAEVAYTEAAHLEVLWLESGKATKAQAKVAKALEGTVYSDIVAGREAVANHDSAATAVALKLFNEALPAFQNYIANNGGTVGPK